MENPSVGRVTGMISPHVGPFVQVDRLGMCDEFWNQLLIFLVFLILDADMIGTTAHPVGDRLVGIVRHLLAVGEAEVGGTVVVEMLADEINVVEAMLEQAARPVSG